MAAVRRRRWRRWRRGLGMCLLAGATAAALTVIGLFVVRIAKAPAVSTAGLSASSRTVRHATAPASSSVSDTASGLSYRLLRSPWRRGCPATLSTQLFEWSAGENAVAGRLSTGGTNTEWYGDACSGLLARHFGYAGPAGLEPTAVSVADALDVTYYSRLRHYRALQASHPVRISGHRAWEVRFALAYPGATSLGLPWTSEDGAVLVIDRGAGLAAAVFYVSVPSNLGTRDVGVLIRSLRLGS